MNAYQEKSSQLRNGLHANPTDTVVGPNIERTPTALEVVEGRLLTGLDQMQMIQSRISFLVERLVGSRPEESGKANPTSNPGMLGRIDCLLDTVGLVINRIAADLAILERLA